jgi:hypothetical protein
MDTPTAGIDVGRQHAGDLIRLAVHPMSRPTIERSAPKCVVQAVGQHGELVGSRLASSSRNARLMNGCRPSVVKKDGVTASPRNRPAALASRGSAGGT